MTPDLTCRMEAHPTEKEPRWAPLEGVSSYANSQNTCARDPRDHPNEPTSKQQEVESSSYTERANRRAEPRVTVADSHGTGATRDATREAINGYTNNLNGHRDGSNSCTDESNENEVISALLRRLNQHEMHLNVTMMKLRLHKTMPIDWKPIFDAMGKRNPVDSLERLWESQKHERPRPEQGRAVAILRAAYGGWLEPKEVLRGERNRRGDFEGTEDSEGHPKEGIGTTAIKQHTVESSKGQEGKRLRIERDRMTCMPENSPNDAGGPGVSRGTRTCQEVNEDVEASTTKLERRCINAKMPEERVHLLDAELRPREASDEGIWENESGEDSTTSSSQYSAQDQLLRTYVVNTTNKK
ncbi:hypothetical protein BKA82DRAFT_4011526 [Pisolithus tinctorius]|nr:hypothetical protein BKA82DRAFT_4011526 [Pisolithus tinctorius]